MHHVVLIHQKHVNIEALVRPLEQAGHRIDCLRPENDEHRFYRFVIHVDLCICVQPSCRFEA
jgi:hypothetical protein